MPIYEYQCTKCGYIFEEIEIDSDTTKISTGCPNCEKDKIKSIATKLLSKFSFKVNGFNADNGYAGHMR